MIWTYGSTAALNHPLFGVGMNEWARPAWMGPSIDNLWLCLAVQYGLPAVFFLLLAILSIVLAVGIKRGLNQRLVEYRTGFLTAMTAFVLVACTVHFWDTAWVFFLFLMGSGVWILDARAKERGATPAPGVLNGRFAGT